MTGQNEKPNPLLAELNEVQFKYNRIGLEDALSGTVGHTPQDLEGYFAHGRQQIEGILSAAQSLGIVFEKRRALDFGCGVGRIAQALVQRFDEVDGLDISPSMIARANEFNADPKRCRFHLHCDSRLDLFAEDSFDLVVGINVFRYIPSMLSRVYIREFMRVIKPGGLVYFETSAATGPRRLFPERFLQIYRKFKDQRNTGPRPQARFHFPDARVRAIISEAGGRLLRVQAAPNPTFWMHSNYFATKSA